MRCEFSEHEWTAIKPMLPNKPRGVRRVDDRRVLDGTVWVLRSGAPWRDLPTTYGPARRVTIASFGGCWTYLADLPDVSNVYFGTRRVPATVHGVVFNILAGSADAPPSAVSGRLHHTIADDPTARGLDRRPTSRAASVSSPVPRARIHSRTPHVPSSADRHCPRCLRSSPQLPAP